jgi:hypothetical protein
VLSTPSTARQILNVISRLNSKLHRYWREGKRLTKLPGVETGCEHRCMIRCAPHLNRFEPPPPLTEKGRRCRLDGVATRGGGSHDRICPDGTPPGCSPTCGRISRNRRAARTGGGEGGACGAAPTAGAGKISNIFPIGNI